MLPCCHVFVSNAFAHRHAVRNGLFPSQLAATSDSTQPILDFSIPLHSAKQGVVCCALLKVCDGCLACEAPPPLLPTLPTHAQHLLTARRVTHSLFSLAHCNRSAFSVSEGDLTASRWVQPVVHHVLPIIPSKFIIIGSSPSSRPSLPLLGPPYHPIQVYHYWVAFACFVLVQFAVKQITKNVTELTRDLEIERQRVQSANRALEEQTEALNWCVLSARVLGLVRALIVVTFIRVHGSASVC